MRQLKIIHAGTMLAEARAEALSKQRIIVRNNIIVELHDGFARPGDVSGIMNATVIVLSNQFEMAGLINSHITL